MRILSLDLPTGAVLENGLKAISMAHLGPVVVLTGPNGAGKSRLLGKLRGLQSTLPPAHRNQEGYRRSLERNLAALKTATADEKSQFEAEAGRLEEALKSLDWAKISGPVERLVTLDWMPKDTNLPDPNGFSKDGLIQRAKQCEDLGLGQISQGCLARIQHAQDSWWEVTHQDYKGSARGKVVASYEALRTIVRELLHTDIERDETGRALLFGRVAGGGDLSEGQKILLQFAVAVHAQGASLEHLVILMDEPENHLHPAAIVDVIERIQDSLGDGQIWIATHSLPLIAQFAPEAIWYMQDGSVAHAGRTPQLVIEGLLGGRDRASRMSSFIDLPAQFAAAQFAYECLLPPGVASHRSDDPQMAIARDGLVALSGRRLLDFGAGKGRLAATLAEAVREGTPHEAPDWDYVAYDRGSRHKESCELAIQELCGTAENRWFEDLHSLLDVRGTGCFDFVVMCNVFHEIEPAQWLDLFQPSGPLLRLMSETAILLIVEDMMMPVGEKANAKCFLILGTDELRTLFAVQAEDLSFRVEESPHGRLKAHFIPKALLGRLSPESRSSALGSLKRRATNEVRKLREGEATFAKGQMHAFWVQLLANATLALDEHGPPAAEPE